MGTTKCHPAEHEMPESEGPCLRCGMTQEEMVRETTLSWFIPIGGTETWTAPPPREPILRWTTSALPEGGILISGEWEDHCGQPYWRDREWPNPWLDLGEGC